MTKRITDFLISQSIQASNLSCSTRLFRFIVLLIILALPTLLCGFLVNFKVAFQMWLLSLAGVVPLVGGTFLISKYKGNYQKVALLLSTGLFGFTAFEFSLLGLLIDERSINFSSTYILLNAVFIGIAAFILSTLIILLLTTLFPTTNNKG